MQIEKVKKDVNVSVSLFFEDDVEYVATCRGLISGKKVQIKGRWTGVELFVEGGFHCCLFTGFGSYLIYLIRRNKCRQDLIKYFLTMGVFN